VPYAAHREMLESLKPALAGRILIDITVPLRPPKFHEVTLPEGQAAALEAQEILGPETRVVATLHHVSSNQLADLQSESEDDVLVCGDDEEARATVVSLIEDLGYRALDAGPLQNAVALESLTPVLIYLTKRYKSRGAGLRIANV
jgi:NADPH-dependent F420 reductase